MFGRFYLYNIEDCILFVKLKKTENINFNASNYSLDQTFAYEHSRKVFSNFYGSFHDLLDVHARELADTSNFSIGQARYQVRSKTQFLVMSGIGSLK